MRPRRLILLLLLVAALFAAAWWLTERQRGTAPDDAEIARSNDGAPVDPTEASAPWTPRPRGEAGKPSVLEGESAIAAAICRAKGGDTSGSATLFGHIKQYEAASAALTAPPAGFGGGNCSLVHRSVAPALAAMIAAAEAERPGLGKAMVGISCHRSVARQAALYCAAPRVAARGYAGQAFWVAPPGFSEHATGRSIDFGDRGAPGCNVEPCFAGTAVGRWLAANAGRFGFALSFPEGNASGVAFEPWHYRYVGGFAGDANEPASGAPPVPLVTLPSMLDTAAEPSPPEEPPPPPDPVPDPEN